MLARAEPIVKMVKQIPKQNRPGPKKKADGPWMLDDDDGGVSVRPPVQLNHALHLLPANPVPSQQPNISNKQKN